MLHNPGSGTLITNSGRIVLPYGDKSEGLTHISWKHSAKIAYYHRDLGVVEFVHRATQHYQKLYIQQNDTLLLLKFNGVVKTVVVAMPRRSAADYPIITAYPIERVPNFAKRGAVLLWER